ncbi:Putative permease often clustered with de novo purine synthesis [Rhodovulum sp. P5]|uniref:AI-2E family transporter n=1 Tax=Rhodovulum sp. P5 TaxID=1564506 RepID=UPI0009C38DE9|nr:AI-2E family transporter [Rhodovulum sp. P5]ARE39874.1 Putative permease often clustered with de novo purine synthesis [Rhodovulum sp. P5]
MALPVRQQITYWGIAAAVLFALLWFLGDVITPFLVGMAVAYFLDPVADRLERAGFSRVWATVTITLGSTLFFTIAALLILPELIRQAVSLVNVAPEIARDFQAFLSQKFPALDQDGSTVRQTLVEIGEAIKSKGGELLNGAIASLASLVNIAFLIFLVPVLIFYLLMDWDRMVAEVDALLPLDHAPQIRELAREIDTSLAGFIRGQVTVCLIQGTFYAVALTAIGLNFGLIVGFASGLLSFIPFVGSVVGFVLAVGLAVFQFWGEWWMIAAAGGIFVFGQIVEGNILTPKLVGGSVGLHPVWLIFALSALGAVFGFVGLLAAVPIAAVLGVLIRFGISQYKDSLLYKGHTGLRAEEDARAQQDGEDNA